MTVCAESHPEATQNLDSDFEFEGEIEKLDIAKFAKQLKTDVTSNFQRSQGLQFYRDSAFQLCQMYFNGVIEKEEFKKRLGTLREDAVNIILHEIQGGFYRQKKEENPK